MSSDEASLYEAEGYASESIPVVPVYPKEDEENDAIVVNATVINDQEEDVGMDESDHDGDNNNFDSGTDDEEEDRRTSVAYAVAVPEGVETKGNSNSNNSPMKELKDIRKYVGGPEEEEEEEALVAPSLTKTRKRKRSQEKKDDGIPSVKDLGIPFRAIKRIMKIHPDIATVQNEAAIVTTYALELFVKKIVNGSYANAKKRGRNTVKYEDLAETRATHSCLSFLDTLLP
mmetsp:Transcript_15017/g.19022  ORF Transcript_15017/g.19022 Transcript_15017/m.19022 type:complete len:230 (+) Transcript_15017:24-713(+)|eukprot:CAMPEP_0203693446 /NCGR_PEP_ID=MMETSP0091-20130426/5424_1 /ASSEMBLY_ACC=CAM_ASM_001089 /TAXON_ID=426623 /ORGANISM="Chaetoceros affinis, Strain CCMP159" /LENGTH=229 /DNA_ID=CAMNT_0050564551 /DNA_START=24 /DNA_END=713 /DNA_ORIENTATION=-